VSAVAPLVEVRQASFSYRRQPALQGVSFQAAPGELVGLVGPNGAGKSTLLRLVAGLLAPQGGSVRLAGLDPARAPRRAVARLCALVPQEAQVHWPFTVREAVMMGRAAHQGLLAVPDRFDQGAVDGALDACDLRPFADRRLDALSGGERRRVFFARALAQEPRLLLLDEPTAFLDLAHQVMAMRMAVGSSSRRSRGSWASARAKNTRRRSPPERASSRRSAKGRRSQASSAPSTAPRSKRSGTARSPWCAARPIITASRTVKGQWT